MAVQYDERPPDGPSMWVLYEGTDTLYTGYGLCFNSDYGTAANVDPSRLYRVEKSSVTNHRAFAGVVHPDSNGVTGPKRIRILRPGAHAEIWAYASGVVGATRHTLVVGQYYFKEAGFPGSGSALCLQTINRSTTAGLMYGLLDSGPQSGLVEHVSTTAAMTTSGVTILDQGAGATIVPTLANGLAYGELKLISMQTCTANSATPTVALHETSDPEVFTFDAVDEYALLIWTGTEWATVVKTATAV